MTSASFLTDFGILFLLVVFLSLIVKVFKQPIIIGYVLSGFLFTFVLDISGFNEDLVLVLAELGITFLLFFMGLEFDLHSLKYFGKEILIATFVQSILFFLIGYLLALPFGFTVLECVYMGILFMFSSTLLVAKWVEDKKETDTLQGKVILTTLIVQDIFALLTLMILGTLQSDSLSRLFLAPLGGIGLIVISLVLARYLLNPLLRFASKYPELLFILGLGVCFLFVEIAPLLGYSMTIGAFIGGVTLANTIYRHDFIVRLKSLVLFFNMLFFVGLGFQMNFNLEWRYFVFLFVFILAALVVKPAIFYVTLRWRGYDRKTAFVSGLSLAQISEFGILIIAASGLQNMKISSIAIISVIVTMILSSYLIKYDLKIFSGADRFLVPLEKIFSPKKMEFNIEKIGCHVLFFGYHDLGKELFEKLRASHKEILVVDNDPENIQQLKEEGIPYLYSSVRDPILFDHIDLTTVGLVVSSITDVQDTKMIIHHLKKKNPTAVAIVTAKSLRDSLELYKASADHVIYPSSVNEQHISVLLEDYTTDVNKVLAKKVQEIMKLEEKEKKMNKEQSFMEIHSFMKTISEAYSSIGRERK